MAATASPTRPLRVFAKNYRTWAEFDWRLPRSGVALVRGRNLDAQRSTTSAVGKTSLLSSLAYALGIGPPTTHTLSWGEEYSEVMLEVELVGDVVSVVRGTGRLVLKTPSRLYEGRDAENELKRRLGDTEILRALTWRKQRARGNFFSLKPAARREFLTKLLGLTSLEDQAEEARKSAEKTKDRLPLQEAQARAAEGEAARVLAEEVPDPAQPDLSLVSLLREEERRLTESANAPPALPPELAELRQLARDAGRALTMLAVRHQEAVRGLQCEKQRELGRCSECGQEVRADGARRAHFQGEVERLEAVIRSKQEELELIELAATQLEAEHRDATESWRCASGEQRSELEQVRLALAELTSAWQKYLSEKVSRQRWEHSLQRARAHALTLRQAGQENQMQEARDRDFAALVRGYVVAVFEEVLRDLGAASNYILGLIPNTSDCSVQFCLEERAGKQEVGEKVFVGGAERDRDDLSGGQEASFELAMDLALFDVISGRGVVRPSWMVLDEPFDGMGSPDKEAFLDYMRSKADRLFLVVDHSREFAELFIESGIGVEKKDGRSRVVSDIERATF